MEGVIYMLIIAFLFLPEKQVLAHKFDSTVACAYGAWRGGFTPTGTGLWQAC